MNPVHTNINATYHQDEDTALAELLVKATLPPTLKEQAKARARGLIQTVRANRKRFGGLDRFLQEFGLSTQEGIALMCLAEALLRIPDSATADALIRDKIGSAAWNKHLGKADDLFVNASTWALMLTGKIIGKTEADEQLSVSTVAGKMVARLGEPVVRQAMLHAMKIMGRQFVMGRTIEEALDRAEKEHTEHGYRHSFDMLGEGARTAQDAARYFKAYEDAIDSIGRAANGRGSVNSPGISIKLSALHPRYEYAQRETCVNTLAEKLLILARQCAHHGIGLTVDAEESYRLGISLEIFEKVFPDATLKNWDGFGLAIQAYQKRCGAVIDRLIRLAEENDNRRMMLRLVKGAYWDSEIKYAQVMGLPGYPVFTRKAATDVSYAANATKLLARRDIFYPMFATHNAYSVATVMALAGNDQTGFEFQRLHGMGEPLYHQITADYPCRVYAPVGSHRDLLPYLVRRLLENGANSSFVNRLQNDDVAIETMLQDPADYIAGLKEKPHPKIPLPTNIYDAARRNSAGIEFADDTLSTPLLETVTRAMQETYTSTPVISGTPTEGVKEKVFSPADTRRLIGTVTFATEKDMAAAVQAASGAFETWNTTPASKRAGILRRMADLMEEDRAVLMALCVTEAGKTLNDAVAEIREAVDFCRYYAAEGEKLFDENGTLLPGPTGESNRLILCGRGVFLCISPWNFPLAIFMGQIAAALMAGNTVIAKPAEQTSLIAARAVHLLLKAGLPKEALALLPADGEKTGAHLVPDLRIAGVCFTGSTDVAQSINKTLALRGGAITPLIAETGGQNAMIVDSSALPEQIVDDVITSAFRSAGQRCSALRVLFLQEDIADKVIAMLAGACKELRLGDPAKLSTDIGPVIDRAALNTLEAHAAHMAQTAKTVAEVPLSDETLHGTFFAPRAFEISSMAILEKEVFGPILHIIRYKAGELDDVITQINATGYGLTFGLHTRLDHKIKSICAKIRAGNCYVNRSMIGATVGVQPFGGRGLSGTGPKAGGPHYLLRFAHERAISINTTASGGNTTLIALDDGA